MSATICLHHQHGHCKYGVHCRNEHIAETCENTPCMATMCKKRHPKVCRYFSISGSCKFNKNCSYLHKHGQNNTTDELQKEIENLKEDIKLLTTEVKKLKEVILSFDKPSYPRSVPKTSVALTNTSLASTSLCLSPMHNNLDVIPMLDGPQHEQIDDLHNLTSQKPFQCETCKQTFQTSDEYKKHDTLQFCCDDCGICYETKLESDLHVLKVHPDETYARNFIPEATKLLFTSQNSAVL